MEKVHRRVIKLFGKVELIEWTNEENLRYYYSVLQFRQLRPKKYKHTFRFINSQQVACMKIPDTQNKSMHIHTILISYIYI